MPAARSSSAADSYERRDCLILRHAAQYGIALNAVLSARYFSGKQSGQITRRLADEGFLELFPRALPGGITYARLTKSGCVKVGVSEKLARPLSGHALSQAIALACYSTLGAHRRHRLLHAELKRLYGDHVPPANVPHVLLSDAELGRHAVLRVHFATGTALETMKQLKRHIEDSEHNASLIDAIGPNGSYGFLLLAPTEAGRNALLQAIERQDIQRRALISVEFAPGVDGLAPFLRGKKGAAA